MRSISIGFILASSTWISVAAAQNPTPAAVSAEKELRLCALESALIGLSTGMPARAIKKVIYSSCTAQIAEYGWQFDNSFRRRMSGCGDHPCIDLTEPGDKPDPAFADIHINNVVKMYSKAAARRE